MTDSLAVERLAIPEVRLIRPRRHGDRRGSFTETWNRATFAAAGIDCAFVQDNESWSAAGGTVRGLHYQIAPAAQAKLVRVSRGRVRDVALDLRRGSPSFGAHVSVDLSAEEGAQLFVPVGFAHGFCTLEPDTIVHYKVDAHYAPTCDRGVRWDDPALGIAWPAAAADAVLSDRDAALPLLAQVTELFDYLSLRGADRRGSETT